ncbi:hypothetical protein BXZ70DRAFT_693926 [Cristinia sonorae]|uniref:DUF6534 domain-containing protein n=1 Tax=Cristinia sonorae TaxID=1940300 RepID=A0A8K0UEM3_9AGAR|nr:hypothetical protein BXZ70DRAFT_693926 [Cristinia sonorae]
MINIPTPDHIGNIAGPLFVGLLANWFLLGVLTVQVYTYYLAFPDDLKAQQLIVVAVLALEVLQSVLTTRDGFRQFASGWGDFDEFVKIGWLWFSIPIFAASLCLVVQLFYAWRIHILGKMCWLPALIVTLSIAQFTAGIFEGYFGRTIGDFTHLQRLGLWTTCWRIGAALACDVFIVAGMIHYLVKSKSGLRAGRARMVITRLIMIALETGFLCTVFAMVDLILYLALPGTTYHLTPAIVVSKLYSNSMLAVLNARIGYPGGRHQSDTNSAVLTFPSGIQFTHHFTNDQEGTNVTTGINSIRQLSSRMIQKSTSVSNLESPVSPDDTSAQTLANDRL